MQKVPHEDHSEYSVRVNRLGITKHLTLARVGEATSNTSSTSSSLTAHWQHLKPFN